MNRRAFVRTLSASLLAPPLAAGAQRTDKIYRVGILAQGNAPADMRSSPLAQGLKDLGWREGQNLVFKARYSEGKDGQLPKLAAELLRDGVDLIFAASTPAAIAARQATSTTPIAFVFVSDPIASRLAVSLGRPGGNATGVTTLQPELVAKLIQLLREAVPNLARVGVLWNPENPGKVAEFKEAEAAARKVGLTIQSLEARAPAHVEPALKDLLVEGRTGLLVLSDGVTGYGNEAHTAMLVSKTRVPVIYQFRDYVALGGLMSYGINAAATVRQAAKYVDRILRGTRPADLPIEQPTNFELVINLKTAQALGLTIPPSVLLRADQIIE